MKACILAGGESRRMGQPKALLPYQERPLIAILTEQLLPFTEACTIVTREELKEPIQSGIDPQVSVITDVVKFRGLGPLAGMYSAILELNGKPGSDWIALLACDMPFFSASLLQDMENKAVQLSSAQKEIDAVVFEGQPFHGLYHIRILPVIEACLKEQRLRFQDLFTAIHVHHLPIDSKVESVFFNMNTPDEYQALLRHR